MNKDTYNSNNIKVLKGLEAVRKRPGMYIGDVEEMGLHHMIWEVWDNSIDEVLAGYGDQIIATLHKDDSISIQDFGRGIPVDIHPDEGISTATVVLTILHAGGKFGDEDSGYKVSGGLHGVGISVVNALSSYLKLTIHKDGYIYEQEFKEGKPLYALKNTQIKTKKNGTTIWFKPDETIFKVTEFKRDIILKRLKYSSYLNKNLKVVFIDEKNEKKDEFLSENGIVDFINHGSDKSLFPPVYFNGFGEDEDKDVTIEVALTYKDTYSDNIKSFANNVLTTEGGSHEAGFQRAISFVFLKKIKELKIKGSDAFTIDDIKEGLHCVISIRLPEAEFKGQTKGKLNNIEAQRVAYNVTKKFLEVWVEENPKIFTKVLKKIETAKKSREAAKRSRETTRKDALSKVAILPGKLTDCQTKDASEAEIFFVEGDSAGGSCKSERNRAFQAVLPLKGKILNIEKTTMDKIAKSEVIQTIITALGCGFGRNYDPEKLRYHKLIILCDADVDGKHIEFLLLLFFFKFYRDLIERGYVYVAIPPLFRAKKKAGGEIKYFSTKADKEKMFPTITDEMREEAKSDYKLFEKIEKIDKENDKWIVSRFKGLGEMNPKQLYETTLDPESRVLVQVKIDDEALINAEEMFDYLGGKNKNFREHLLLNFSDRV